jgi:hypothetical protein
MAFIVAELSIELAEVVEPLLARIKARDKTWRTRYGAR